MKIKILVFIAFLLLSLALSPSSAFIVDNMSIIVWKDNSITVKEVIYPEDYDIYITVETLGEAMDIIATSSNGTPLNYEIRGKFLSIEALGSKRVILVYTVRNYTKREGAIWELKLNVTQSPVKIIFPKDAIVIHVSDIPIEYSNNTIVVGPGDITIYYTFESILPRRRHNYFLIFALVGIAGIGVIGGYIMLKNKRKVEKKYSEDKLRRLAREYNLNDDELNAIIYLIQSGGRCRQAELRKALNLPKTTVWRMIRRLEQMGLVKLYKVGRENWIELTIDMQKYT
ncbi:hypothetical protein PNA2_1516 [Pyrococcus sp. NA2]|uniref:helix-turn-helix transcriptional regulator n=1 Tax=Pyrococcus sp. (strain NA2) TaxID=342949 RepID=UPI000209B01E|nr:winged helix-turn-helix transcriptional regulator [Pyrococcus sp. NA2]AEC52431.1 hypothetical protein PNA2_1516 [Pyrococcus sp. NA2]